MNFLRSAAAPDLDDAAGGEDPPPMGQTPDGEHVAHLRRAYGHMTECARCLEKALGLLDDGPLGGPAGDDLDPVQFDPAVDDNPQGNGRRALMQSYARALKNSMASNI